MICIFSIIGCSFEEIAYEPVTTLPYQPPSLCSQGVDPQMAGSVYYSSIAPLPISHTGLVHD